MILRLREAEPEPRSPSLSRYQRRVDKLLRRKGRLEDAQVKAAFAVITATRRQLTEDLQALPATAEGTWQAEHLRGLRAAIDRAMTQFAQRYNLVLGGAMQDAWSEGESFTRDALSHGGIVLSFKPDLSLEQLEVAMTLRADLVGKVSAAAREGIAQQVTLGVMGQRPLTQTIRSVAGILTTQPSRVTGIMGPLATQAERIVRTEMSKTFSMANRLRSDEIAEDVPGLLHYWRSAGDGRVRASHVAATARYAPGGTEGPIPHDRASVVGGVRMRFPHDPLGPAREVVNCRCVDVDWHPAWFAK